MTDARRSRRNEAGTRPRGEIHGETDQSLRNLLEEVHSHLSSWKSAETPTRTDSAKSPRTLNDRVKESCSSLSGSLTKRDPLAAARACLEIAEWSEAQSRLRLATSYVAAAATLNPGDSHSAYLAGRLARQIADYCQSEFWFREAITRGTATLDWAAVSKAYSGLGNMHRQAGAPADAQAAHMRSLAIALKHDLRSLRGDGYHNLAVLAFEAGAPDDGVSYARKALDAYGDNQTRIATLASDLGYVWLTHEQAPERALAVFTEVRRLVDVPSHQIQVLANIARAKGMLRDWIGFDSTRLELENLITDTSDGAGHAAALLDLAHGAASLGRIHEAQLAANRAVEIAEQRQEGVIVEDAYRFLETLPLESEPAAPVRRIYVEQRVEELVFELMEALR